MKPRTIIPLAIGLALGFVAIKLVVTAVKNARGATTDTVQVVYASGDIAATSEIKDGLIEVKSLPRPVAPKAFFSDKKEVAGRVASMAIPAGLPIVPGSLAPKGTPPGLAVRIKDGFRAVSVQVDESTGVAGWVKPGCHVDVVAVLNGRSGVQQESISQIILQNVEVLAVGQDGGNKAETEAALVKSVTLAVTPEEMPKLHLAATKGKIRLAMRSQTDESTETKLAQATDNDLIGPAGRGKDSTAELLAGLLAKLPKADASATDKGYRAHKPDAAPQGPVVVPAAPKIQRVEVFEGSRVYDVLFEGEGSNLRRLSGKERPGGALTGLQAGAGSPIATLSGR